MRGSTPVGVPATSAPGGIHTMPSGVGGGRLPASQGGGKAPALDEPTATALALEEGDAPCPAFGRQPPKTTSAHAQSAPVDARKFTRRSRIRSAVALSKAELLHLELQTLARDLQQAGRV